MLRKNALRLLAGLVVLTSSTALVGTIAWFLPTAKITKENDPIKGVVEGAYFAYGNGHSSSEGGINKPFGINKPRHLYNLAWLTYLGYFKSGQYYFEIDPSLTGTLDMDGWILPPIGTPQYPFMGNFNGNGKIIENLAVSNSGAELTASTNKHPAAVSASDFNAKNVNIVGVFGTIGNLPSTSYTASPGVNKVYNLGLTDITVKTTTSTALIGSVAGYVNGTLEGVAIDNGTVNIPSATSALGTLGTDTISKLSEYTVVGYATTNYKKQITKVTNTIYGVNVSTGNEFNAREQGESNDWGGSINMKTIYYRLYGLKKYKSQAIDFPWRETKYYYGGVENVGEKVETKNYFLDGSYQSTMRRYQGKNATGHEYIGNYNFYSRERDLINHYTGNTPDNTTTEAYLYLGGGHEEIRNYRTTSVHTGYYITDGTNYLYYDGTNLGNTTSTSEAGIWSFSNINDTTFTTKISTNYAGSDQNLWLRNNGGTLTTTNSEASATTWTVTRGANNSLTITNGTYSLSINSGNQWGLYLTAGYADGYYISNGTQYIVASASNTSNVTSTTNQNSATVWHYNANKQFYFTSGGNDWYLSRIFNWTYSTWNRRYTAGTTYNVTVDTAEQAGTTGASSRQSKRYVFSGTTGSNNTQTGNFSVSNGYYVSGNSLNNNRTYYVRYNGGWTTDTTERTLNVVPKTSTPKALTDRLADNYKVSDRSGPDYYQTASDITRSNSESGMYYTADDTTYFPLNVNNDLGQNFRTTSDVTSGITTATMNSAISNGDFDPKEANTGYIVSGSNNIGKTQYNTQSPAIRVSEYYIENINESFTTSMNTLAKFGDDKIWTIPLDSNGDVDTEDTMDNVYTETMYSRYVDSKKALYENALTTNSNGTYTANKNVYGLHFVNTEVSMDHIVNAENIYVEGKRCGTYQMPVNTIDFNLKQKGVINFFAGTYFSGNDSFFSIHQIMRNNDAVVLDAENQTYTSYDTINEIREIVEVWSLDEGKKTSKYSNIYKYKYKNAQGTTVYSYLRPYREDYDANGDKQKYVMNMNNTNVNTNLYSYDYNMSVSDFNAFVSTYGYTKRFDSAQIGQQASAITLNRIYYFEFPMNGGEYCLGSVSGSDGCYLLYLDIGANAAKTQRTIAYEHFKIETAVYEYPLGVAVTNTAYATAGNANFSDTDTALAYIKTAYTGTLNITRVSTSEVTMQHSGTLTNAKPTLVGELMWDSSYHRYNIHIPNGANLSDSITPSGGVLTEEYKRCVFYDWSVNNDELMTTVIEDKTTSKVVDGTTTQAATTTRTFLQTYANGTSTTVLDNMRIYNTSDGSKYSSENLSNPASSPVHTYDDTLGINTTVIGKMYYILPDGITSTNTMILVLTPDSSLNPAQYYMYSYYLYEIVPSSGSVEVRVVDSGSVAIRVGQDDTHYVTITINVGHGNAEQTITVPVS